MFKPFCSVRVVAVLNGCAATPSVQVPITNEKREFFYDYAVSRTSKHQLSTRVYDYLAVSFQKYKLNSRAEDKRRGIVIAKGLGKVINGDGKLNKLSII